MARFGAIHMPLLRRCQPRNIEREGSAGAAPWRHAVTERIVELRE
jgi:hypothetical protein